MEFDAPLFKILAHNDTGQAVGHQGGVLIPKELEPYFPSLSKRVTQQAPTQEEFVTADLFDGDRFLETVDTRYQYQTWGGGRTPERRLTKNLGSLRNLAQADDLLVIERSTSDEKHYRLRLIRKGTSGFELLTAGLEGMRWGLLQPGFEPVREAEVEAEAEQLIAREHTAFSLFEPDAGVIEARHKRVARSRAFQSHVSSLYQRKCAVCGQALIHPSGRCETQAAHIVPRRMFGSDDARNGIQLCRSHHWAFDEGLFGIGADYRITVPERIILLPENSSLCNILGAKITLPADAMLAPNPEALHWHMQNILFNPDRLAV